MLSALSLKLDDFCCLVCVYVIFWYILIRVVSKHGISLTWSQIKCSHFVLELDRLLSQRHIRLTFLAQDYSNRQKLFLNIHDTLDGYPIVDVSWYGEVKIFPVCTHVSSVPHLTKSGLGVFFVEKVSINEDVIITVFIKIFGMNSKGEINVVVFIIITFWFIASDDDWVSFLDIFFDPLEKIFVLRLGMIVVPDFICVGKFFESLLCVLSYQNF